MTHPLDAHARTVETCVFGPKLCRFACPVAEAEARETVTPWGLMTLVDDVRRGRRPLNGDAADVWARCTGCGRCTAVCKHENPVFEALRAARGLASAAGLGPISAREWAVSVPPPSPALAHRPAGGSVQLVVGDAPPEAVAEALSLLSAAGYPEVGRPAGPLPAGWCHAHDLGLPAPPAAALAAAFTGAERVVALDARAVQALRQPGALPPGVEALHLVEAIVGHLPAPARPAWSGDVAYLDGCRLGRGLGLYAPPRTLLAAVIGGVIHEAAMAGSEGGCCGLGAGYAAHDPLGAAGVAQVALDDLDLLDTPSPLPVIMADGACAGQLAAAGGAPVWRLSTLLARALAGEEMT